MTKLVMASTIAGLLSARLEQHGSTRSTRRTCRVASRWAKWNLGFIGKLQKDVLLCAYHCYVIFGDTQKHRFPWKKCCITSFDAMSKYRCFQISMISL